MHSKLPVYVQDRWNRQALKVRKTTGNEAKLEDLMELLQREVNLVSDPLYSREANLNQWSEKKDDGQKNRKVFMSNTSKTCPLCSLHHDLDDCLTFLRKSAEERKRFVFKSRLCFSCYEPSSAGHSAKTCPKRRTCNICKMSHPTGLHGCTRERVDFNKDQPTVKLPHFKENPFVAPPDKVKSSCTTLHASVISLCVVPVRLYSKVKQVSTYALLDNGSQGSFLKESYFR